MRGLNEPSVAPLLAKLLTLDSFVEIGLGYLSLDRRPARCRAAKRSARRWSATSGRRSTDVTYVFDEPTIGLHPTISSG